MTRKGYGQLLREAWRLYSQHFKRAFGIALTFLLIIFLLNAALLSTSDTYRTYTLERQQLYGDMNTLNTTFEQDTAFDETNGFAGSLVGMVSQSEQIEQLQGSALEDQVESMAQVLTGFFLTQLINIIAGILTTFALISIVFRYHNTERMGVVQTIQASSQYFGKAIGLYFLILAIIVGFTMAVTVATAITALLPPLMIVVAIGAIGAGITFGIYWMFAQYAIVVDETGPINALRTSFNTVRGNWWRTFGYVLLTTLIIAVVAFILAIPLGFIQVGNVLMSGGVDMSTFLVSSLYQTILQAIIMPFAIAFFYIYYRSLQDEDE